jgi:ABC-type uncharacterized transport system fused permease/ATPase subunit
MKGTFRDIIIYPDTQEDMKTKEMQDSDLQKILEKVRLNNLVDREGNFDAIKNWNDALDIYEKQMIMISKALYFKPDFLVLGNKYFHCFKKKSKYNHLKN